MKRITWVAALFSMLMLTGCYVATIETGRPAGSQVISKPWASCWLFGLVPPPIVQAGSLCPGGVSKVETQHSFLNGLVGGLTWGIYTPIQITVTCAEGSTSGLVVPQEILVPSDASSDEVRSAFGLAAEQAVKTGYAVYVRFDR